VPIAIDGLCLEGPGCHGGPGITFIPATTPAIRRSTAYAEAALVGTAAPPGSPKSDHREKSAFGFGQSTHRAFVAMTC
jgi:hypothetical protein